MPDRVDCRLCTRAQQLPRILKLTSIAYGCVPQNVAPCLATTSFEDDLISKQAYARLYTEHLPEF